MFKHSQVLPAAGVELRPAIFEPPREQHDVYMLVLPGAPRTCVPLVHVQSSLRAYFDAGEVEAFDLYRLEQNGPAMRVLAAQPQSLIVAVQLKEGQVVVDVPTVLAGQRKRLMIQAFSLVGFECVGCLMN
jgi:hypothetical protein